MNKSVSRSLAAMVLLSIDVIVWAEVLSHTFSL